MITMGAVGLLCKGFLAGLSKVETHGMNEFLQWYEFEEANCATMCLC